MNIDLDDIIASREWDLQITMAGKAHRVRPLNAQARQKIAAILASGDANKIERGLAEIFETPPPLADLRPGAMEVIAGVIHAYTVRLNQLYGEETARAVGLTTPVGQARSQLFDGHGFRRNL